jgi:hypothetical protein
MDSVQDEMRCKRNPNPNPKDVRAIPRHHAGSATSASGKGPYGCRRSSAPWSLGPALRTRLQSRCGVTATPPWPDLTSSKATRSKKGLGPRVRRRLSGHRRVGSGRHLRALPRAGSTVAHSPSGERRMPVSGLAGGAASPTGWPPAASSLSRLASVETESERK